MLLYKSIVDVSVHVDLVLIHDMGMAVEQEGGRCTETNSDFIVANLSTIHFPPKLFLGKYNDSKVTSTLRYFSSNERELSNGNDFGHFSANKFDFKEKLNVINIIKNYINLYVCIFFYKRYKFLLTTLLIIYKYTSNSIISFNQHRSLLSFFVKKI